MDRWRATLGPRAAGMRLSWPGLAQTPAPAGGPRGAGMTTQQPEPPEPPELPPELESELDESELRRELLNDVSPTSQKTYCCLHYKDTSVNAV